MKKGQSQLKKLKRVDLSLSQLSLAIAPLDGLSRSVEESESDAVIDNALDAGINFIDTAPLYGYESCRRFHSFRT